MYIMGNVRDYKPDEWESVLPALVLQHQFLSDQDWLIQTIQENQKRIEELRKWGVKFIKERGKERRTGKGVFAGEEDNPNIWIADGGAMQLLWSMRAQTLKVGAAILDRVMITDLLTSDGNYPTGGEIVGAVGFDVRKGGFTVFKAKAVILAAGSSSIPRRIPPDITGDGHAMGIRAGATMRCMDIFEFLGGGAIGNATTGSTHVFTSFGLKMINAYQEAQKENDYSPRPAFKKKSFDLKKAMEVVKIERKDIPSAESYGGPCWDWGWRTSYRECTPKQLHMMYRTNYRIMKIFEKLGYEIPEDETPLIRVPFSAEGTNGSGGVRINRDQECDLPGLFAGGGVTDKIGYRSTGLNGAFVAGAIAGANAAAYAAKKRARPVTDKQVNRMRTSLYGPNKVKNGLRPLDLRHKILDAVLLAVLDKGFLLNEASMQKAVEGLESLKREYLPQVMAKDAHQLMKATEMKNMLDVFPLLFKSAMVRKESRVLPREDYPMRDDKNWLKFVNTRLKADGDLEIWTEDIPNMRIKPEGVK
jgi:succinate dehydrogenase/fumarate reductase flavoprotein subunit